jgi:hypothetical protein
MHEERHTVHPTATAERLKAAEGFWLTHSPRACPATPRASGLLGCSHRVQLLPVQRIVLVHERSCRGDRRVRTHVPVVHLPRRPLQIS